jgi:nucleoside-diphosphate-sugar epimerase
LSININTPTILLTGASGFLGKSVYNRLKDEHIVSCLSRSKQSEYCIDLADSIPLLPHFDMVIHAAGKAHIVSPSVQQSEMIYQTNFRSTQNLLLALTPSPPECLVFISSVAVYGCESGLDIDESYPLSATDAYGISKIECEKMISQWCVANSVRCLILRLPLVAGSNAPGNLRQMALAIKKGYYFRIGDGSALRTVVRLADVSELLAKSFTLQGTYNISGYTHLEISFVDQMIANLMGRSIHSISPFFAKPIANLGDWLPFIPINRKRFDKLTQSLTFSDQLARNKIGWTPQDFRDSDFLFDEI